MSTITDEYGNEYELVDEDEDFDLDAPLTRADFAAWIEAQQGQRPEWSDDEYDEEELSEEEEAYWGELAHHVDAYERWRGHPMTQRELESFVERFDQIPSGELVDTREGFNEDLGDADQRTAYMAEYMEGPPLSDDDAEGEGEAE